MSKSTKVNECGCTPFANGRCQSLLQSTSMGSHPLLMEDVNVYYNQRVWVHTLANGGFQSLLQSTSMGSHPLLMVNVKVYYSQQEWVHTLCYWKISKSTTVNKYGFTHFANGRCQSLLKSTSIGSHPLLMVDVKVYYSQRVWVHTLC